MSKLPTTSHQQNKERRLSHPRLNANEVHGRVRTKLQQEVCAQNTAYAIGIIHAAAARNNQYRFSRRQDETEAKRRKSRAMCIKLSRMRMSWVLDLVIPIASSLGCEFEVHWTLIRDIIVCWMICILCPDWSTMQRQDCSREDWFLSLNFWCK